MDKSALYKLSYGLYIVGVKSESGFGGYVVDAVAQVASGDAPMVLVCCMKTNHSNALIKSSGELTLSVLPDSVDPFVIANFGFQSSRDVPDKWANVAHTVKDGLPTLDGAVACLRLRVTDSKETETHTAFFTEVVDAWKGEAALSPLIYASYQKTMKAATTAAFKAYTESGVVPASAPQYRCTICGHNYDGATPFEQLPEDWVCPKCGVPKSLFEQL
ncbi:MAG: flavin reductase [Oscillospiraceae bacterium]|jgi:flavin reductase (DIM6/NTAB) family NADH-FMN oxidoreductase RutF/rubredoxin|nr:flavin reductase [Oscillospiraceae bacterium]